MSDNETLRMQHHYARLRSFEQRMRNPGFRCMFDQRNQALSNALLRLPKPLSRCRILDFGCGHGVMSGWLRNHGARPEHLTGTDIQPARIAEARRRYPDLNFMVSGDWLPFPDKSFDVVICFTVFSSILDPAIRQRTAAEITRVLAPGGVIIWYDIRYPNPANKDLRAMTLLDIRRLFPLLDDQLEPLTLLPPLAERLGPLTDALYPLLASFRFLRSHYFGLLLKKKS